MRVLVTGGAGFIGSHTVEALLARGDRVRILDNFTPTIHANGRPEYLPADAEIVEGDVRDKSSWEAALEEVDTVVHLAAYQDLRPDFSTFFAVNVVGTSLLYEVAVERDLALERVVLASSQAVLGEGRYVCENTTCRSRGADAFPEVRTREQLEQRAWDHLCASCGTALTPVPTDEAHPRPRNQYALSKYTQELVGLGFGAQYAIPTVALRYSIVQGPRQSVHNRYSGACRLFCLSHFQGNDFTIYEDGHQLRDFININDVVSANLLAIDDPRAVGRAFNVAGPRGYTVLEFAQIVKDELASSSSFSIEGDYRYGDTRHIVSDAAALRALGWSATHTPQESVRAYAEWLAGTEASTAAKLSS